MFDNGSEMHGPINPLDLLGQCFHDLVQLTQDFIADDGDDPRSYLKAVDGLKDSVDAVVTAVFVSIMTDTRELVPIELLEENLGIDQDAGPNEDDHERMHEEMEHTQRLITQTVARAAAAGRL